MTVKRVTIGAKPVLVHRETEDEGSTPTLGTSEIGSSATSPVEPAVNSVQEPTSAASSSIEDWLRQGDAGDPAPDQKASVTEVADIETIATPEVPAEKARTEAHANASAPQAPIAPAPAKGRAAPPIPPWAGIAGGAVAGAAVALAVTFLVPKFAPTIDLRMSPLTERVALIETGMRGTGEQLGRLNNEISQTLDDQTAAVARLDKQAEDITSLQQAMTEGSTSRVDPVIDVSSPVFAVALGQLRSTFYTGRPFEAELVNVYAIAGTNELFSGYLTELAAPARTGMPNAEELRRVFPSYVAVAGLQLGDSSGVVRYGLSMVNRYVGLSTEPYDVEEANLAVTRADAQLATGDVEGAVGTLRDMGPKYTLAMQPWLDAARNYVRAETAITEMTRVVLDKLREKVGKEMSVPANEPAAAEPGPAAEPAPATEPPAP